VEYKAEQLRSQLAFLAKSDTFSDAARVAGGKLFGQPRDFVLSPEYASENLFPSIRTRVRDYFHRHHVTWHGAIAHLLSSQACCLNFLEPFAYEPRALKTVLEPILGPIEIMLEPEPDSDPGRFIAFEFIGARDYLNEGGKTGRTRGANCTSVDAAVRFQTRDGSIEAALIEWKYTESYGAPKPDDSANPERLRRYSKLAFFPDGPLRADCGVDLVELFSEPVYQLFRQQMLAMQIEKDRDLRLDRVRTVFIAPRTNQSVRDLRIPALHRFGSDVLSAWSLLLHDRNRFVACTTEELFHYAQVVTRETPALESWRQYIADRYLFA